ncbi:ABC transporter, ATP-binding protein [Ancylostoma duodenale]|uniref:ABC transporter, ATP-binding protein n=1 Tax=Ancylostoma duodenale TaxID=51022 RepID=A0A0C2CLZ5_9BILA|nr:ABC transporter, ATP-binding protein [Ancylostoma duodenale]
MGYIPPSNSKIFIVKEQFRFGTSWDHFCLFIGLVCAILSGISQPVLALVSGRVTNVLLVYPPNSKEFRNKAYENVYIFLGIGVFIFITNFIQYVRAILRQNAGWFDKNHSGTLTTKLNDNMERIREGIGDKLGLLLRGCAMFVASVIIAFIYEWRLALMMLGVAPSTCLIMSFMARVSSRDESRLAHGFCSEKYCVLQKMTSTTMKELAGVGKAGSIAEESLMGVRTVQAFNGQQEMVDRYSAELSRGKAFAIWKGFWSGFLGGFFFFVLFSFLGCGMLYGGYLLKVQIIKTPGEVFIVVMSMLLGAYFLGLISPHLMVLLNARVAAATVYQAIDRVPKIDVYSPLGRRPDRVTGRVVFENVHFRYPSRKDVKVKSYPCRLCRSHQENSFQVLNGLNLVIEPGQTVALVGHSGCGKSTSVGLLTRLYEPEAGRVTLDGEDVRELNIEWLRNTVGIVQQEPCLFNDTVEGNLRMGNPHISMEQMVYVCKMANAHDFIVKLPKGYETYIGDGGVQLSGGQKQRIAIARTLARDPKVLLLDEATSALDAQSESIVQSALNNASRGRSTIVIAHRLSTVRDADKIVYFEKGEIAEQGTHEQLVALRGSPLVIGQFEVLTYTQASTNYRSGYDAFVRGQSMNDSFGQHSHTAEQDAENEARALEVKKVMEEDGVISAGFYDIYKNATGNYHWMLLGLITAMCRGLELPALALIFGYVFEAFTMVPWGADMMHRLCMAVIIFSSVGVGIMIFQLLSVSDASYFDNPAHTPGKLITRLATDAPNIKAVIDGRALQVIYAVTAIIACVVIGFVYCWQVTLLGIGLLFLLATSMIWLARTIMNKNIELIKNDEAGRLAIETIENVRTIQLLTRTTLFYSRYESASKNQKRSELAKGIFEGINFTISQSFTYIMMCLTYAVGIHIIYTEQKTSDKVFRSIIAMLLGSVAVMNSSAYFPEFVKARTAAGLLFSMIYRKPKTGDADKGEKVTIRGNILFDDVKFSYPQRPRQPVMRGLQFSAQRGQTVALVGPSGSGKSTIISMLERFYDATGGFVRFDGKDIKTLSLNHLRTQMALVGQEPRLFAGTIKDNICFGLGEVPMEQINRALELANAKRFLSNLPAGIDTEVGEKGTQLSGGQKQRIAIARALVRDPKILLLDEATSALDSESERAVQEALDLAREGRTCITIAHRLSSIQNADLIVYVENGKVRESGTHSQLMHRKGRYYQLIKKQDLAT